MTKPTRPKYEIRVDDDDDDVGSDAEENEVKDVGRKNFCEIACS